MRSPENIRDVAMEQPDLMGFIFFPGSRRFVHAGSLLPALAELPDRIGKVGVFVNQPLKEVLETAHLLGLDFVQLHGTESLAYAAELKKENLGIIKVFRLSDRFSWERAKPFSELADYFLFDTPTKGFGGSGRTFDWKLLKNYPLQTPFFLSGGIGPENIQGARSLSIPELHGIDVNSRLEHSPGLKDMEKVRQLINAWRT